MSTFLHTYAGLLFIITVVVLFLFFRALEECAKAHNTVRHAIHMTETEYKDQNDKG